MQIRPATTADREAIRTVARETWHDTYTALDSDTIDETVDEWYADEELEFAVEKPGMAFLVAEMDGDVVGFIHGVVLAEEGDVLRLCVHPDHQGEGIGTALYDRLKAALEDFNMKRMRALDLASNEEGREFYEGLGFERTDEAEVEFGDDTHTEAVYTLQL